MIHFCVDAVHAAQHSTPCREDSVLLDYNVLSYAVKLVSIQFNFMELLDFADNAAYHRWLPSEIQHYSEEVWGQVHCSECQPDQKMQSLLAQLAYVTDDPRAMQL